MSYCPKDGTEFQAPPGAIVVCPACLLPYADKGLPFVEELDPAKMPLALRNEFERARDQMMAERLRLAREQKKIIP